MSEIFLTVTVVVALTVILSYFSFKQKNSTWKGELIKKDRKSIAEEENMDREFFVLIFKDENNRKHKLQVDRKIYDKFEIGQKVIKKKGEYLPKKG